MALKIAKFKLQGDNTNHQINHGLNTDSFLISVWKNGLLITPSVKIVDKNNIELYNVTADNAQVVIVADVPTKTRNSTDAQAKRKSSSTKSESS